MKKQSGAIISVLGFLLFGMAASTIYFVSNGAGANSRLAKMRKQLDEQNKKSEAVAATLTEKEGRLAVMEKQHENLSSSRNKQHNVSTKNQLNIENQTFGRKHAEERLGVHKRLRIWCFSASQTQMILESILTENDTKNRDP